VLATGAVVALLTLPGDLAAAWSLSAFAVLLYYAVTNLAALRLPALPTGLRVTAVVGLLACTVLATRVESQSIRLGLFVLAVGLAGRAVARLGRR
jgi:APA family basic amino acid/polyamine antiporter